MSDEMIEADEDCYDPSGKNEGSFGRKGRVKRSFEDDPAMEKPARFSERGLFSYVDSLVAAGRYEDATRMAGSSSSGAAPMTRSRCPRAT